MSVTYPQYPHTNFPEGVDQWDDCVDVSTGTLALVNQYKSYCAAGNFSEAQTLLNQNQALQRIIFNANRINQMQNAIMAIEQMWNDDVEEYLNKLSSLGTQGVSLYTDSYDSTTGEHNFVGAGSNGKVYITGPFAEGFSLKVNGTVYPAYMGTVAYTGGEDYTGKWITFIYDGTSIIFGGGVSKAYVDATVNSAIQTAIITALNTEV